MEEKIELKTLNGHPLADTAAREELKKKQETLESGKNIKTFNGQSLLGEGDFSQNIILKAMLLGNGIARLVAVPISAENNGISQLGNVLTVIKNVKATQIESTLVIE